MTEPPFNIEKIRNDLDAKKAGSKVTTPLTGGRKRQHIITDRVLVIVAISQFLSGIAVGAWLW